VLAGSALVAVTGLFALKEVGQLLGKTELVVVLGLTSLQARTNPFIPIVHKDKNH